MPIRLRFAHLHRDWLDPNLFVGARYMIEVEGRAGSVQAATRRVTIDFADRNQQSAAFQMQADAEHELWAYYDCRPRFFPTRSPEFNFKLNLNTPRGRENDDDSLGCRLNAERPVCLARQPLLLAQANIFRLDASDMEKLWFSAYRPTAFAQTWAELEPAEALLLAVCYTAAHVKDVPRLEILRGKNWRAYAGVQEKSLPDQSRQWRFCIPLNTQAFQYKFRLLVETDGGLYIDDCFGMLYQRATCRRLPF